MRHPQPPTEGTEGGPLGKWPTRAGTTLGAEPGSVGLYEGSLCSCFFMLSHCLQVALAGQDAIARQEKVPRTACVASTTFPATCPGPGTSWLPWSNNRLVVDGHAQLSRRQAHRVRPGLVRETYTLTDPEKQTSQAQERLFLLYQSLALSRSLYCHGSL